jgi:hypothetical protein
LLGHEQADAQGVVQRDAGQLKGDQTAQVRALPRKKAWLGTGLLSPPLAA